MGIKEIETKENADFLQKVIIGFIVVFLMTYFVVLIRTGMDSNDYSIHADWALMLEWNKLGKYFKDIIAYPLWHFGVNFCTIRLSVDINKAAALITALFNGFAYLAILNVWSRLQGISVQKEKMVFWAAGVLIVNPLYAPWINPLYYLGQAAPNAWHNPTNIAVKGFAVMAFGLIMVLLNKKEEGRKNLSKYILLSIMLVLSALAKPSFLQGLIPGLGVFIVFRLIVERKKFNLKFYFVLCASFIPSVMILFIQMLTTFFNTDYIREETKICIGWGKMLHQWTPNLFYSFLVTFAFPVFVLLLNFKKLIRKEEIQALICYELVTWLETVLLYEEGKAFFQGNFTWAGLVSSFVVWVVMTYYFIQEIYNSEGQGTFRKKVLLYGGTALFTAHLLFGIMYWYRMLVYRSYQ